MFSIIDWIIDSITDSDDLELIDEVEEDYEDREPWWLNAVLEKNKNHEEKSNNRKVYYKIINNLDDIKDSIDHFKLDTICIVNFKEKNDRSQEIMNYIIGAVYALDGNIIEAGRNIFIISQDK